MLGTIWTSVLELPEHLLREEAVPVSLITMVPGLRGDCSGLAALQRMQVLMSRVLRRRQVPHFPWGHMQARVPISSSQMPVALNSFRDRSRQFRSMWDTALPI